jgi:hypothetical protein
LSLLATLDTPFTDNFQEEQIAGTLHEAKAGMTALLPKRQFLTVTARLAAAYTCKIYRQKNYVEG